MLVGVGVDRGPHFDHIALDARRVVPLHGGRSGGNCIKIGLPGKLFSVREKVFRKSHSLEISVRESIFREDLFLYNSSLSSLWITRLGASKSSFSSSGEVTSWETDFSVSASPSSTAATAKLYFVQGLRLSTVISLSLTSLAETTISLDECGPQKGVRDDCSIR